MSFSPSDTRTRFRALSRPAALSVLALTVVAVVVLLVTALAPAPTPAAATAVATGGDVDLYSAIVARMQAGQGYYPAAHAEMLSQGYGTGSVFNWRTPLYPTLLSLGGPGVAQVGLALVALLAVLASAAWVWSVAGRSAALGLAAGAVGAAAARVKRVDYFVPPAGAGAEMIEGSTAEVAAKLAALLKAKGGIK